MAEFVNNLGPVFKGNRVNAHYVESENPMYRHNAFIEALPPLFDAEEAASLMRRKPVHFEGMREWDDLRRADQIQEIFHYIEPLPEFVDLEQRFSRMIRNGYMTRNPLSEEWVKQMNSAFEGLKFDRGGKAYTPTIRSNSAGFSIIGASGAGKSTAVESVLSLYDQVIEHTEYNSKPFIHQQLVWLKLECPSNGSTKALCQAFFVAVDEVLGTDYFSIHGKKRITEEQMVIEMGRVACLHGLGALVIDEIQRLNEAKSGGADKMLNFFVLLTNTIGVPVVLVGTFRGLKLIKKNFAHARRSSGQGDMLWTNMAHDKVWDYFIEGLWLFQWVKNPVSLTNELRNAMYEESQGIIDIAVKLYMLVQWSLIGLQSEIITPGIIRWVAKDKLKLVQPALKALRFGKVNELESLEDLLPNRETMMSYLSDAKKRVGLGETLNTLKAQRINDHKDGKDINLFDVASVLVQAGYGNEVAKECARKALGRHAEAVDKALAVQEALKIAEQMSHELKEKKEFQEKKNTGRQKGESKNISLSRSLIDIVGRSSSSPYMALKEAGIIKPVEEFLDAEDFSK